MSFEFAKTFLTRTCLAFLIFVSGNLFAQATFTKATYQTLSQQEVDVLFNQTVSSPNTTGWTITVAGTSVPITSATMFGTTVVRVKFNASSVAGHTASEVFVKPGEAVTVSYNGSGTLTSSGGVTAFSGQTATNNWVFDCSTDIAFYQETDYGSVDQCAPVVMNFHQWQYRISLRYFNSSNYAANNVQLSVSWGDGNTGVLPLYQSDLLGVANASYYDATGLGGSPNVIMTTRPSHTYPSANPTDCSFDASVTPYVPSVATCTSSAKSTIFATYDTDNQNSGTLALPPPLVVGTDMVCKGTNVGMMFNDNTSLNCRSAIEPIVPNQSSRWIRIVYGSQDNGGVGNIPDIRVTLPASLGGGTVLVTNNDATGSLIYPTGYYPTGAGGNNVPDGFGVIQIPSAVTAPTGTTFMGTITTADPSNQVVNQKLWVRIEYWDVCNPYAGDPTNPAPVTSSAPITIISKPPALTATAQTVCYGTSTTGLNFNVTGTTGSTTKINWYKDKASVGGTPMTNSNGTNSANFSLADYTTANSALGAPINTSQTGGAGVVYSVWATQVYGATNACESDPVEVTFIVLPKLSTPGAITGLTDVCLGTSNVAYSLAAASPAESIAANSVTNASALNYTTQYQWSFSSSRGSVNAPTNTQNVTANFITTSGTTTLRVSDKYTTTPNCTTGNSTLSITVDPVTVGGSVGPNNTICNDGSSTGTLTLTGYTGTIQKWQRSIDGGTSWTDIAVTTATFSEIPAFGAGTYMYRAVVKSGACASANSSASTITVNTIPPQPTISQSVGSTGLTICADGVQQTILQSDNLGGVATSFQWYKDAVAVPGATSNTITLNASSQSGSYTVQSFGAAPTNCPSQISNPIPVLINPLPTASNPTGGGAVCSGNPAPDIVWTLTGTGPYTGTWTDGTSTYSFAAAGVSQTSTELRVSSPNTLNAGTYQILSLTDANGCVATSLGGTATISIGGTAPSIDPGSSLTLISTCDNGSSTLDPSLTLSLDDAGSSNTGPFTLTYKIDGGSSRTKTFNTGANGNPTTAITFTDSELDNVAPSPHVISLVSLLSPFGCLATLTNTYNFTVNPLPSVPTGAVNGIACSSPGTGVSISVADPGVGFEIAWSTTPGSFTNAVPGSGSVGASPFNIFTPSSSATATYYAFAKNSATGCYSASSLAVTQTQDNKPANAVAGLNQNICSDAAAVTLAATPPTNSGIGSWSVVNSVAYYQNFEDFANSTTASTAANGWTRDVSGANAFPQQGGSGYFEVKAGQRFEAQNTNGSLGGGAGNIGEVVWTSQTIDISGIASATASVDVINVSNDLNGGVDADYVKVSYILNGGAETPFPTNGSLIGNFANSTASATGLTGSTLVIVVRISTNAATETVAFDNVFVKDATAAAITFSDANSTTASVTGLQAPLPGGSPIVTTLRWTVASALGACATSFSDMTVTINPLPTVTDPAPQLCEDVAGGGSHAAVDLTSYNTTVTNASTVVWYTDAARTSLVGTPTSVTINNSTAKTFYFKATSAATCVNYGTLTFTVNPLPLATDQNLSFCEDFPVGSNQHAGIDLTSYNNAITGGAANRTVAWFSDTGLTTAIGTPTNYTLIGTQTLYAKVTDNITGCVNKATVSLVLNPLPQDNPITGNATVCASSTNIALYQVDPTKNPGSNFTWNVSAVPAAAAQVFGGGGTNSSNFFVLVKFPASGTVTITMTETLNGCAGNTSSLVINVNNAPSAISISGLTQVCTNQTGVVYTVPGANATSTYTWTASGATFPGASSGVGLSSVTVDYGFAPSSTIGVTETSSTGCVGAPASVSVNVNSRPSMTSVNASTTCSGIAPTLVFTSSLPSTYSWTVTSITGTLTGTAIGNSGTGDITTVVTNKSGATGFVTYDVTPKATAAPNCAGAVQSVTITVNPEPVLVSPQTKTICSGQGAGYEIQLTPATLPSGTVFNWPDPDGAGPATAGVNVPAGASGTIHINDVLTNTTSSSNTITYVITPTSGSCVGTTSNVAITVNPEPIVATGLDRSSCSDTAIGLILSTDASSIPVSDYNIISKSVPGSLIESVSNRSVPASRVLSNYLTADQYTNTTSGDITVSYSVQAVSDKNCFGPIEIINIVINPEPVLSSSLDSQVCSGLPIGIQMSTSLGSVPADSYSIVGRTVQGGLIAGGGNRIVPATKVAADYLVVDKYLNTGNVPLTVVYQVSAESINHCVGNPPQSVTITILPEPVVATNLNKTVCSGDPIGLTLNTNGTSVLATNYNIIGRSVDPGLVPGVANALVPNSSAASGSYLSNDFYTNTTGSPLFVTYTVVANTANCSGAPQTITITINPEPVISSALDELICSNAASGLVLNTEVTSVSASKYDIISRSIAGGLTSNSGNANVPAFGITSSSYLVNDKYVNTSSGSLDVTYTVAAYGSIGNCEGRSLSITVTVEPEPVVANSLDRTICSREPTNLILNTNGTSVAATRYQIVSSAISPGLVADPGNAQVPSATPDVASNYFVNDKFINTTTSVLSVLYTVIPISSDHCLGAPQTITIKVNPEPVIANGLDTQVCSDNAIGLIISTDGAAVTADSYNIISRSVDGGLISSGLNKSVPANNVSSSYLSSEKFTNMTTGPLGVYYEVLAKSGNCFGQSRTITITINPEPILSSGSDNSVCSDSAIGLILSSDPLSVVADSYNLISRTIAPGLMAGSGNVLVPASNRPSSYLANDQFNNVTTGTLAVTYSVVPVSGTCLGDQKDIVVTIKPEPVIEPNLDTEVCSGIPIGLTFSTIGSSVLADAYNVTSINVALGLVAEGGNKSTRNNVAANYVSGDKFLNTGNTTLTVVYTVVPVTNNCLGDSKNITVSIDPEPVVANTLNKIVCSSLPTGLVLNTNGISVGASSYDVLSRVIAPGLMADPSNVSVPRNNVTASYLSSDKFTNVTANPLTVTYQVVPVNGACEGAPLSITITVNPEPVLSAGLDKTACSDVPGGIVLNTNGISVAAATYDIVSVEIPSGLTSAVTATVPKFGTPLTSYLNNDTYNNKGNSSLIVRYTVVPVSADVCQGSPVIVKQIVYPEPVLANLNNSVCSDVPISLTLNTIGTSVVATSYDINGIIIDGGLTAAVSNAVIKPDVAANYLFNDQFTNVTIGSLNVNYDVTPINKGDLICYGDPSPIVISIDPKPVLSTALNQIVCSRGNGGIILSTNGTSVTAATYNITSIVIDSGLMPAPDNATTKDKVDASYLSADKFTNTTSSNLTVHYTVVPVSAAGCLGDPLDVVLTIKPEPVIDPALATTTVCSRENAAIVLNTNGVSVAAVSYDVALVSQDSGLTGTPTTGTGLTSIAIQNDHFTNTGAAPLKVIYSVTPHSADGCVGQPFTITLTVNPEPVVSTGLDNAVCSKDAAGITLSTNGSVGASSYKLVSLTVPLTITADGGNVTVGQTGGISLIKGDKYINTTSAPVTVIYGIIGIGPSPTFCEGQPTLINLTVNPEPILSPGFVSVCSDVVSNVILGAAVGSAPIDHYNLKKVLVPPSITAAGTNAGLGTYATNNFIAGDKFTNTTSSPVFVNYTIAPVSSGCVGADQTVQLTVNPAPAVATNLNKTVCSGNTSGILLATTSSSIPAKNYNITSVVVPSGLTQTAGGTGARTGINPTEIISDIFNNSTGGVLSVTYTIVPVSASGCLGPAKAVVLTVEPKIIAAPANNKPNICSGDVTSIDLISSTIPSSGSVTFNYSATSSIGGQITGFAPAASNLPLNTKIADALVNNSPNVGTVTYSITPVASAAKGGSGCYGTPVNVTVKVEPKPIVVATPLIQTVCESNASNIKLTTATVPTSGTVKFTVTAAPTSGLTLVSPAVAKTVYVNNESISDVWSNSTTTVQTVTYTIQAAVSGGTGCVGNQITVTLNVNPLPNVTATTQAPICSNDVINISLSSDVANTINSWTASVQSGAATGFASSGAGDLIFQTLKNTGSIPAIIRYTVTPKANNCIGPVITKDVEVDPIPDIIGVPASLNICYGSTLNVPLSSSVTSASFAWTVDPSPNSESVSATGSGSAINQLMNNSSSSSDYLSYSITATGPGVTACQSSPKLMTVVAGPKMAGQFLNPDTWLCFGNKDFLQIQLDGQAPFTLVYNDGSSNITLTKVGNFKSIQIQPTSTQTFKLVSMTDALNCTIALSSQVTFTVGDTDPTFSVITPLANCSPYTPQFKYNQVAGVEYTWRWGDGSPDSTYIATTTISGLVLKHGFDNPSPTQTLKPKVTLQVDLPSPFPGCIKTSTQTLSIYPQLKTFISQNKTEMCSGETVSFTNQTAGALTNTWYYRELGNTSQQLEPKSTRFVSYTMTNTSTQNPIIYEVYYKADNALCPADTTLQVKVYRAITAGFNEGTVPPFVGGNSTVTFTNTSTPVDDTQFRYDWNFGTDATPGAVTDKGPISVNYSSPGPRDIVLTATNVAAEAAGLSCASTFVKTINVELLPLIADFDADPKAACYPGDLKVSVNNSTGDTYNWRVVDQNGSVVATSNAPIPTFRISAPGKFSIILVTSSSVTGQQATKTLDGFEFYDIPVAAFIARPALVYVPDTEMSTFNSSVNSTSWLWDFGDGTTDTEYDTKHTYKVEGIYDLTLIAMMDHGNGIVCKDTAQQKIVAKQGGQTKIPNAFTPNPNGPSGGATSGSGSTGGSTLNDVFLPIVKGVEEFNMQIFDRWGNLLFESNNQTVGWDGYQDGRLLPAGVYVYKLTLRLSDNQRTTQIGDVTLIR